jgi:tetratricopeptide (TPR) repeat protein/tRNA A-37 threonylcarbamoyl transferase component Bud32
MAGEPGPLAAPRAHWEELFDQLVELPAPERARRLGELRAADPELAGRLARLLAADAAGTGFLDGPTLDLLGASRLGEAAGATGANADGATGASGGTGAGGAEDADAEGGAEAEDEPQLPPGTVVGPWRVVSPAGRGGMGEVYLAERGDPAFAQRVALKVIKRGMDSQAIVRRFVRERQILARLDHPNLARLLDGGTGPDGRPYFALEWVEGEPITSWCRRRGLDLDGRLRLIQTVCQAVASAHQRLVVHRDLKPANILVTPDGTPKLLDFGIAKLLADEAVEGQTLTQLGARVLTPAYAAPEQILGEPVSTATDVYALGVLLYELITGTLPHRRDQRALSALASAVEHETVERPSAVLRRPREDRRLARRVAGDLDLIVMTAMHRDPARRYPSARALDSDLGNFLAGRPIRARPDELGYRARKFVGRHRLPVAAVGAGVAALVAGLVLSLWQAHAARLAAARADAEARRAERVKSFLISVFQQSDPDAGEGGKLTARELLGRGAASIDSGLAGEPEVQADLLDAVARIETNLSLIEPALAHARRALALRQARLPPTDGRVGLSRMVLGEAQEMGGAPYEARKSFDAALPVILSAFGADSIEVAQARRDLADTLRMPAAYRRRIELQRQALETFVRRLGEGHVESARTLDELGVSLELDRQYREAEAAYRRSAELFERSLGPRSAKVASVYYDLAGLLDRLGRQAEARPLFERAIAGQRAALGPRHVRLADSLFSYGILLMTEEEHAAAEAAFAEALSIYGPERYEAGHCLRYLGLVAMRQERYARAADLFARAAEIYGRTTGELELDHQRALANLGWAHLRLGRVVEARGEIAAAVDRLERIGGPESYEIRWPLEQLGEALTAAGEADAAVAKLRRARALGEKLFGTAVNHEVAVTDLWLARALLARGAAGDAAEARRLLDEGLATLARTQPRAGLRGEALLESGRLALAENGAGRGAGSGRGGAAGTARTAGDRDRACRDLAAAEPLLAARKGAAHAETREARRLLAAAGCLGG